MYICLSQSSLKSATTITRHHSKMVDTVTLKAKNLHKLSHGIAIATVLSQGHHLIYKVYFEYKFSRAASICDLERRILYVYMRLKRLSLSWLAVARDMNSEDFFWGQCCMIGFFKNSHNELENANGFVVFVKIDSVKPFH